MSPRRKQQRQVSSPPLLKGFKPIGLSFADAGVIHMLYEEYEALRLADYSGMKQEEAARLMKVSRPTFTRIYSSCLKKLAQAFTEGKAIVIEGGDVEFDKQWYRCNACDHMYHHPEKNHGHCILCGSDDIDHINQQLLDWQIPGQAHPKAPDHTAYCTCAHCGYEQEHKAGVPCFSQSCPECQTPLIRKRD